MGLLLVIPRRHFPVLPVLTQFPLTARGVIIGTKHLIRLQFLAIFAILGAPQTAVQYKTWVLMNTILPYLASVKALALLAVSFQLLGLLTRDELRLRLLLLLGTAFYIAYYLTVGERPMWEAVFASALLALANIYALVLISLDRSTLWMKAEMRELFAYFPTFKPGQFRRIMRHAKWRTAEHDVVLCRQGEVPEGLYFFFDGTATLQRNGKQSKLTPRRFIGEMSFLRGPDHHANATVVLKAGSKFVVWDRVKLMRQTANHLTLNNAFNALFNRELLEKLDRSWPEP